MRHCGDNDSLQQCSLVRIEVRPFLPCRATPARCEERGALFSLTRPPSGCTRPIFVGPGRPSRSAAGASRVGKAAPHSRNLAPPKPRWLDGWPAGQRRRSRRSLLQLRRSCFPETGDRHACVQNGQCCRASAALRQRSQGPDTQGRRDADQNYFQKRHGSPLANNTRQ